MEGNLLVFPNKADAWHGYRRYVGPRFAIQMHYMTSASASRTETLRHRFSAFVKGLSATHPA